MSRQVEIRAVQVRGETRVSPKMSWATLASVGNPKSCFSILFSLTCEYMGSYCCCGHTGRKKLPAVKVVAWKEVVSLARLGKWICRVSSSEVQVWGVLSILSLQSPFRPAFRGCFTISKAGAGKGHSWLPDQQGLAVVS